MVQLTLSLLALASTSTAAVLSKAAGCPVDFEGRPPRGSTPASFDAATSLYNPGFVKGGGLNWSNIITIPGDAALKPSLFDTKKNTVPFGLGISDASIFAPSATYSQPGFRRAELMPAANTGLDNSTTGIKTLHLSIQKDNARLLNTSHEYQLAFLETNDFSTNQFALKYGTIFGRENTADDKDTLILQSNVRNATDVFKVKFKPNVWHNFALALNFEQNTLEVLYSEGYAPLKSVSGVISNDNSGQGQYHCGILKKPTGAPAGADITQVGFQPSNINEGVFFGGIFQENSRGGCVSKVPC